MKLFVVLFLVWIMVLAFVSSKHETHHNILKRQASIAGPVCPQYSFFKKHVCENCGDDITKIKAFAQKAHLYRRKKEPLISVFIGSITYKLSGKFCVFTQRTTKYNCRNKGDDFKTNWDCYRPPSPKDFVIAKHDSTTGHYNRKDDQ